MSQFTLRGLDRRLQEQIRELARSKRISRNKAAVTLLERGAGLASPRTDDRIGSSLDHLIGTWSAAEARQFEESIAGCEQIDKDLRE
jgi:hypothetical protein